MSKPVLRPRCWSGKNSTLSPRSSAHASTARGVRRRADRAAVPADERLQRRGRVHVGDGHHPVDRGDRRDLLPRFFDLVDVGHVGHRAAGVEVGEDHPLVVAGEHVGRFGHEVHTAEHDVGGLVVVRREAGQLERVADLVGPADHLVALVVVAEDHEPIPECELGRRDPRDELVRGREGVAVRQRSLETKHFLPPRDGVGAARWPAGDSPVATPRGCRPRSSNSAPDTGPACPYGNTRRRRCGSVCSFGHPEFR